jgi:hypothetical protein
VAFPDFIVLRLAAVLVPDYITGLVLDHHYVGMAILVDVADRQALEPARLILGDEVAAKAALAVVVEPVEVVVGRVAADQVEAAVAIQVGGRDAVGIAVFVHDQVFGESDGGRLFRLGPVHDEARQRGRQQNGCQCTGCFPSLRFHA